MSIALKVGVLQVLGNYSLSNWFTRTEGASNITLTDLYAEGLAMLEVARLGNLEAVDIQLDIMVNDINVQLENPGLMGSLLQGAMNSIGTFVFDTMKPFIMSQVNTNILGDVNKNLRTLKQTFPNSIPPLDIAIAEGRKYVRRMGYDPYKVEDFNHSVGVIGLQVTHIWVTGMASFYRVGNITVTMENNTLHMSGLVGTQQLEGKYVWEVSIAGLLSKTGQATFTVDYMHVAARVNQSLDVRNKPQIEDLQLTLGNIQLRFDGTGSLDYVVELIVNVLPNLLRYQIMDAIEEPLKRKIQEIFDELDIEKMIEEQLPLLDKSQVEAMKANDDKPEEGLTVDESQLDDSIF